MSNVFKTKRLWKDHNEETFAGVKPLRAEDAKSFNWKQKYQVDLSKIPHPDLIPFVIALSCIGPKDLVTIEFLEVVLDKCYRTVSKQKDELVAAGIVCAYRCCAKEGARSLGYRLSKGVFCGKQLSKNCVAESGTECKALGYVNILNPYPGSERIENSLREEKEVSKTPEYSEDIEEVLRNTKERAIERCNGELKDEWNMFIHLTNDKKNSPSNMQRFCYHWDKGHITVDKMRQYAFLVREKQLAPAEAWDLSTSLHLKLSTPEIKEYLRSSIERAIKDSVQQIPTLASKNYYFGATGGQYPFARSLLVSTRDPDTRVNRARELLQAMGPRPATHPLVIAAVLYESGNLETLQHILPELTTGTTTTPLLMADVQYIRKCIPISNTSDQVLASLREFMLASFSSLFAQANKEAEERFSRMGLSLQRVNTIIENNPKLVEERLDLQGIVSVLCPSIL